MLQGNNPHDPYILAALASHNQMQAGGLQHLACFNLLAVFGLNLVAQGRPSQFSRELAAQICEQLSDGMTLREVCRADEMPSEVTVRRWATEDREGFSAQYAQARETGYHAMADDLLEIADDDKHDAIVDAESGISRQNGEFIARSRLRVDTRKWLLSKALPKIYGDKITNEHTGKDGGPIATADFSEVEIARRVAFLLTSAAKDKI